MFLVFVFVISCKNFASKSTLLVPTSEKSKEDTFIPSCDKLYNIASIGQYKLTEDEIISDVVNAVLSLYAKDKSSRAVDIIDYKVTKVQSDKYNLPINTTNCRGTELESYEDIDFCCLPV